MGQISSKTDFPLSCVLFFTAAIFLVLSAVSSRAQKAVVVDRIVAVVNDEIITLYDLNLLLKPYARNIKALGYSPEKQRATLFKVRQDLLNELIDRKLTDQEIKKNKISVSEQEIDKAIERLKASRSYTDEDLRAGLAQQGLTMGEFRNEIKQQILRMKLVNREVKSKIVITPEDVKAYYEAHRDTYAGKKQYHLWNVFVKIPPEADEAEKRAARQKMETALAKLKQGASIESLVGEDTAASPGLNGGDLGLFRRKELSEQLQQVVKSLHAGMYSPVLETEFGYQIIYVQKIIETGSKSLAQVTPEIEDILYKQTVEKRFSAWLGSLRKRSAIKIIN